MKTFVFNNARPRNQQNCEYWKSTLRTVRGDVRIPASLNCVNAVAVAWLAD